MSTIHVTTFVAAPAARVFDLSRNLSIYRKIFKQGAEQFSSTAGGNLLNQGDTILINAKHLGKIRSVTLKITAYNKPWFYTEEQIRGDLFSYKHEHHFKEAENGAIMIDIIEYEYPRDMIGKLLGKLYMKKYMEELVNTRNRLIKDYAESEKWKAVMA